MNSERAVIGRELIRGVGISGGAALTNIKQIAQGLINLFSFSPLCSTRWAAWGFFHVNCLSPFICFIIKWKVFSLVRFSIEILLVKHYYCSIHLNASVFRGFSWSYHRFYDTWIPFLKSCKDIFNNTLKNKN